MAYPNILFVMVDCLRADVCYGMRGGAVTPSIDALKVGGASFTRLMSVSSTTTPNISSFFTGMYPFEHGVKSLIGYKLAPDIATLAEILKNSGYNTYGIVSGPITKLQSGLNRGFDVYEEYTNKRNLRSLPEWLASNRDRLTGLTRPWFTYLHVWDLHDQLGKKRVYADRVIRDGFNNARYGKTDYERSLSSLDPTLGELFGMVPENTLIMLSGDHGENYDVPLSCIARNIMSRVPYLGIKPSRKYPNYPYSYHQYSHCYNVYDFLINIPLIVNGPGAPKGAVLDGLASQVDLMPTILELAGLGHAIPAGISGRSLVPAMRGEHMEPRPVYLDANGTSCFDSEKDFLRGVRTEDWKFIFAPDNDAIEPLLFDLKADPGEDRNIYHERPDMAGTLKRMIYEYEAGAAGRHAAPLGNEMTDEEKSEVEEHLRALGYMQ